MTTSLATSPLTDSAASRAWILLIARLLPAPLFIYSGIGKILAFSATAARLPGGVDGFGRLLTVGSIALELGCALALIFGLFTRQAALLLVLFTFVAAFMFHNFWASPDAIVVAQTINFLKNLGLIGGFALIAIAGPGAYSCDAVFRGKP